MLPYQPVKKLGGIEWNYFYSGRKVPYTFGSNKVKRIGQNLIEAPLQTSKKGYIDKSRLFIRDDLAESIRMGGG